MIEYKGLKWTEEDERNYMPLFVAASKLHDDGSPFFYEIALITRGPSKGMWRISGSPELCVGTSELETLADAMELAAKIEAGLGDGE